MSDPTMIDRVYPLLRRAGLAVVLGLALLIGPASAGAEIRKLKPPEEGRTALGTNVSSANKLLQREFSGNPWMPLHPKGAVFAGDWLMALPGNRADVESVSGVHFSLWGNVPELSAYPVLESVALLHVNDGTDLEFVLVRGRVVVANHKNKGPARVRVVFLHNSCTLTLREPGTEVALELFGRWPPGYPVTLRPISAEDTPTASLGILVIKGQADLKAGAEQYALNAPPGPAAFSWDNVRGGNGPTKRDKLPSWAEPGALDTPEAKAIQAAADKLGSSFADKGMMLALQNTLKQDDATERKLAVYSLGAVDDLPPLADALANFKHADAREAAAETLRHWIGRGTGQDLELYEFLHQNRGYTEAQSEIVIQLLHGFSREDRERPETYEELIAYMGSSKLAIRELASQLLYHWAPDGKDIAYDPAAAEDQQEKAIEAWKKLLADGKLPPKEKPASKP